MSVLGFSKTGNLRYRLCLHLNVTDYVLSYRKIEIVQFASRTRQLFVRLLALVKWASNAGKVEKCAVRDLFRTSSLLVIFILVEVVLILSSDCR